MVTTSTHDTKRGEDARARIAVLSRCAADWGERVREWHALLDDPAQPLDRNEAWFSFSCCSAPGRPSGGRRRIATALRGLRSGCAAMLKSVREAGVNTRWTFGDAATRRRGGICRPRARRTAPSSRPSASSRRRGRDAAWNWLDQTVLKLTVPGVPDTYRGAEVWEQSLVDPDNRRPFDFASAADLLAALSSAAGTDPFAKFDVTRRLLKLRQSNPRLFAEGSTSPCPLMGPGRRRSAPLPA